MKILFKFSHMYYFLFIYWFLVQNFLKNFASSDAVAFVARVGLLFQMVTTFPLLAYITRLQFVRSLLEKNELCKTAQNTYFHEVLSLNDILSGGIGRLFWRLWSGPLSSPSASSWRSSSPTSEPFWGMLYIYSSARHLRQFKMENLYKIQKSFWKKWKNWKFFF